MLALVFHYLVYFYIMLIGSEKPLWGEFNKLLYCIVLYCIVLEYFTQNDFMLKHITIFPLPKHFYL